MSIIDKLIDKSIMYSLKKILKQKKKFSTRFNNLFIENFSVQKKFSTRFKFQVEIFIFNCVDQFMINFYSSFSPLI